MYGEQSFLKASRGLFEGLDDRTDNSLLSE